MNRSQGLAVFFAGLIVVQVAVPVSMIMKREATIMDGVAYRFKTMPVDPYDAFRGRYVAIRLETDNVSRPQNVNIRPGQKINALLAVDDEGYAGISAISTVKPAQGDYLTAIVDYVTPDRVHLKMPIDRYYMEEKAAPRAEAMFGRRARGGRQDAYVTAKIKDGFGVIEGLFVGNKRIEEALQNLPAT